MARSAALRRYDPDPRGRPFYEIASPTLLAEAPADPREKKPDRKRDSDWQATLQHLESRRQALNTWRLPVWSTQAWIARYLQPNRMYLYISANLYSEGLRKDFDIVDRTGTICGYKCSAGLMSGLTDPDRKWLTLGPGIPGIELDQAGQRWYEEIEERYNYVLTHSNFYEAQAQHYNDLTFFGTSPVIDYEDDQEIIRCYVPCAGEYMLGTGFDFSDEVLYREFRLTASQIVEMFGVERCPGDILKMWKQKGGALEYQSVIGHAIEPNFAISTTTGQSVGIVPGGFTWREVYWLRGAVDGQGGAKSARPLSMTGFHGQPFQAARWYTQGNEAYGRGLGEDALGDVIQLQLMTRQLAEAIEKVVRPPMGADVSLMNLPASTSPGKITYFNTQDGEKKFFPLYEVKPDIAALVQNMNEIRERIAKTFFNDVFQPMEDLRNETRGQVTATEIDAIKEERLLPLGPVFGRVYNTLRPRVQRHLSIMARKGLIPPRPPSLRGIPTRIDFISMLTAAQKATSTAAIARTVQFAGSVAGQWPEAALKIDIDNAIEKFQQGVGAPSSIVRTEADVKKLKKQMQQQQALAQAAQATLPTAQAAKALSEAKVGPDNALGALVPGQGA